MKEYDLYDLHTHFYTNWEKGRFSLERGSRKPKRILKALRKAGLDGIVLANAGEYGAWKKGYEEFLELAKDRENLGEYNLVKRLDNALIFADEKGLLKIIKGQEVHTIGHILAIGLDYGEIIPSRLELDSALKEIRNTGAILDVAHPFGIGGIGKENLIKYKDLIDVYEKNQNYEHILLKPILGINPSKKELNELSKEIKINWIPVSDCHNFHDVGNGHIKIEKGLIDFSNKDNLKDSLKEVLRDRKFDSIIRKPNSLKSVIGHIAIFSYDFYIRNKLGLIKSGGF